MKPRGLCDLEPTNIVTHARSAKVSIGFLNLYIPRVSLPKIFIRAIQPAANQIAAFNLHATCTYPAPVHKMLTRELCTVYDAKIVHGTVATTTEVTSELQGY